ncbi:MAG: hypothetical protein EOP53_11770 [Sphingobacteriales bacterium]|nr:MAG: hypothetical protein EOP53_11770 [Sphingobacteriales bacterium]
MRPYLHKFTFKSIVVLLCSILLCSKSFSQHLVIGGEKFKVEAGLNFGPTFFLGDLGGNAGKGTGFIKDVNLELTKMMKGAFITVYPTDWLGLRVAGQYTYVSGKDYTINTDGVHESWRKQRNLDFKSNMWEVYGAIELYPTIMFRKYNDYDPRLKPYGFVGVGLFHFDPQGSIADVNGNRTWHKLHPLRTEGQGMAEYPEKKPYNLTQLNVPMGFGLKFDLTERINIGAELLYRHTFTDYIDDVSTSYIDPVYFANYLSPGDAAIARKVHDKTFGIVTPGVNRYPPGTQRGNSKLNDAYFSTLAKVGIKLGSLASSEEKRMMRQTKCPFLY